MPIADAFRLGLISLVIPMVAACQPTETPAAAAKPENIVIAVDKDGKFYWNGEPVTCAELSARFAAVATKPGAASNADFCGSLGEPHNGPQQ